MKIVKWMGAALVALALVGCGNNPTPERTFDGFDPPYNYY